MCPWTQTEFPGMRYSRMRHILSSSKFLSSSLNYGHHYFRYASPQDSRKRYGEQRSCNVLLRTSQSSIFLEHIIQYYFSPHSDSNGATQCPINEPHATRQVTQLYNSFTRHLPAAMFFEILFSTFCELDPAVWAFRAISHLYRHLDQDFCLSVLIVSSMARHLSLLSGNPQYSSTTFETTLSTQVLEKLVTRTHDLIQRFPGDLSSTPRDLLLDLVEALGTLVNSRSVDALLTEISEALLTLCLTASVINEFRYPEFHSLKALEKVASPRLFASLVSKTSLATFDHTTGCWLSTLRSYDLINLAKALEHTMASFHAGEVPHRRPYKRRRKASLEPGPGHGSDEWEECKDPGRGRAKQTKVKARNGTPSESSVSGLEDAERRKRVKRPRVKVTYQPSEEGGTEDGSPVHSSGNEDSNEAYDQDKEVEDAKKPVSSNPKENMDTQSLKSPRKANISSRPLARRGHPRSRLKVPRPQPTQITQSSQSWSFEIRSVSASSASRQETHRSCLSSDDDLNLFACSSPR